MKPPSHKRKIIETALIDSISNINISQGQWKPDCVSKHAPKQHIPASHHNQNIGTSILPTMNEII